MNPIYFTSKTKNQPVNPEHDATAAHLTALYVVAHPVAAGWGHEGSVRSVLAADRLRFRRGVGNEVRGTVATRVTCYG